MQTNEDVLDFRNRTKTFADLEQQEYDLLVIGAGISGAGCGARCRHARFERLSC